MIFIQIILCIALIILITYLCGMSLKAIINSKTVAISDIMVYGFLSEIAIFDFLSIIFHLLKGKFSFLFIIYIIVLTAYIVAGFVILKNRYFSTTEKCFKRLLEKINLLVIITGILIIFQIFLSISVDWASVDDPYYQGITWRAVYYDEVVPAIETYTGAPKAPKLEASRVCIAYPLWFAVWSKLLGIHPAIVYRMVISVLAILMLYVVYSLIGRMVFKNNSNSKWLFILFMAVLMLYDYSIDESIGIFMLVNPFYGKSISAGLGIPLILHYGIKSYENSDEFQNWILLFLSVTMMVAFSSMASILGALLIIIMAIYYVLYKKQWKDIIRTIVVCIPVGISFLMYFIVKFF